MMESLLYDCSACVKTRVADLEIGHLTASFPSIAASFPPWVLEAASLEALKECAVLRLKDKIELGLVGSEPINQNIVHTAPHHDDIMLSYHPAMHR